MKQGLYLVGTDTEAGKTITAAALVAGLRARGLEMDYFKPVGSDAVEAQGVRVNPDAVLVCRAAGLDTPLQEMNPLCLEHPLSPLAAARLEGRRLEAEEVERILREGLERHAPCLVEGVGGLLVPLCDGLTFLDLMERLPLPVVLVARPGLGTINHTLLSLEALARRGLEVVGFVFSGPEEPLAPGARNSQLIAEFSGAAFLGALPLLNTGPGGDLEPGRLAELAQAHLDLQALARALGTA